MISNLPKLIKRTMANHFSSNACNVSQVAYTKVVSEIIISFYLINEHFSYINKFVLKILRFMSSEIFTKKQLMYSQEFRKIIA